MRPLCWAMRAAAGVFLSAALLLGAAKGPVAPGIGLDGRNGTGLPNGGIAGAPTAVSLGGKVAAAGA
jgi:hypothetical protein